MSPDTKRMFRRETQPADILITGAHVLDPRTNLDEPHDILIRDGHIAELGEPGSLDAPKDAELINAEGIHQAAVDVEGPYPGLADVASRLVMSMSGKLRHLFTHPWD